MLILLLIANAFTTILSSSLYDTQVSKFQPLASSSIAADVTWEFNDGLEGWASATYNQMQAEGKLNLLVSIEVIIVCFNMKCVYLF